MNVYVVECSDCDMPVGDAHASYFADTKDLALSLAKEAAEAARDETYNNEPGVVAEPANPDLYPGYADYHGGWNVATPTKWLAHWLVYSRPLHTERKH